MTSEHRGLLIALEGGEASGKTTQARILADRLGAVLTREPGGTAIGERVRTLLLDPDCEAMAPRTEALLMAAARAQHVEEVINPALEAGINVVTDRFIGSSLAYQGFGRGLDLDELKALSAFACDGLDADLVILLSASPSEARRRLGRPSDRLEAAGEAFHARVLKGFESLAERHHESWVVVDADGTPDQIAGRVWTAVSERMSSRWSEPKGSTRG